MNRSIKEGHGDFSSHLILIISVSSRHVISVIPLPFHRLFSALLISSNDPNVSTISSSNSALASSQPHPARKFVIGPMGGVQISETEKSSCWFLILQYKMNAFDGVRQHLMGDI